MRRRAYRHYRRCKPLEPGCHIGRFAQGQMLLSATSTYGANDYQPSMDSEADCQSHTFALLQTGIEVLQRLDDPETCSHGTLRIVFVGSGKAKVDEQPITEVLGDIPVKALDNLSTGGLIGLHHFTEVLWIELAGERG